MKSVILRIMPETVQWMLPDGRGGGPLGKGSFTVRGPLPGDVIELGETKKRGRTTEVLTHTVISAARSPFPCPVVDRCGGCDLAGLADRQQHLMHMIERGARHTPLWVDSPRQTAHRARVKLSVEGDQIGFRASRSRELVAIERCPAARDEVNVGLAQLRAVLPVARLERVEIRTDGERVSFVGEVPLEGANQPLFIDGLRVSPRSFFQANLEVNRLLVQAVLDAVSGASRVLDLCAGVGNFSVPIARRCPVVAVEIEGQATKDLRHNAGDLPIEVHTRAVERFDATRVAFDAVVLDPPRAGATGVVERLILQRPPVIVYVSCHLPSAMRDLQPALASGYTFEKVVVFDMFPDTHHVETLLVLRR